ncbi:phosphatase PAP2 family protein [Psychrobacter sp. M13]|uniref:phosphatase PAP2 family protein n=1 Tax=Psychrobacter sp. M13 TaxID=3067275 RepID=UPI00273B67B3|nr:phosphatase PAP2 family protein [Psychrobacter sp. M13]WLP93419.1 phosphatase PAP2 family protein [Psychrobacter sp. M13]
MITLLQTHQPLLVLSVLLLIVIVILWGLQYVVIRYGKSAFMLIKRYWHKFEQYFGVDKRLTHLKNSQPKLYQFLWRRLHAQHFHGLPLNILSLLMIYIAAVFVGLVEDVVTSDSIVALDHLVSQQMSLLSEAGVIDVFIAITSLASTPITILVMLLTAMVCWVVRQRYIIIGLLIAVIGSTIFTFVTKMLFQRARPIDILLLESTYSFPSGHATVTVALYGFLAYIAIRFSERFAVQVRIVMMTILVTVLIGLSRIVLNEHYLSDVLGGYLVGTLWLTVAISVTEWLTIKDKINWQITWSNAQIYLVWFSVVGVLMSTLIYARIYQFPLLL